MNTHVNNFGGGKAMKTMAKMALVALAGCVSIGIAGVTSANAAPKQYYISVVPGNVQNGVDTGIALLAGQTVSIRASGWVTLLGTQPMPYKPNAAEHTGYFGPNGSGTESDYTAPNCNEGSLIGYVQGGSYHCLGTSTTFTADHDGDLWLEENDAPGDYADNLGSFEVLIQAL